MVRGGGCMWGGSLGRGYGLSWGYVKGGWGGKGEEGSCWGMMSLDEERGGKGVMVWGRGMLGMEEVM